MRILKYASSLGAVICAGLFFNGCNNAYKPVFEQIKDDKLRVISTVFSPSTDVSPGDTVDMTIHFAGSPVVDVGDLKISYNHVTNTDTFINRMPLQPTTLESHLPDSYTVTFVVPDTVLGGMSGISEYVQSLGDYVQDSCGGDFTCLTSSQIDSIELIIPDMRKLFKWSMISFLAESESGKVLEVWSEFMVRYNRKIPFMEVNENPPIEWVGLYVTDSKDISRKSIRSFQNSDITFYYLYNSRQTENSENQIPIYSDSAYYLAAGTFDSDGERRSSPREAEGEQFVHKFFYQIDEIDFANPDSAIMIDNNGDDLVEFLPPLVDQDVSFRIWAVVYDALPGVLRPRAFSSACGKGEFVVLE